MEAPLNYPCVMLEKHVTLNKHLTKNIALSDRFALVQSDRDFYHLIPLFINPVITHYYEIVNEVKRLEGLFN